MATTRKTSFIAYRKFTRFAVPPNAYIWYMSGGSAWYIQGGSVWYISGGSAWYISGALLDRSLVQYSPARVKFRSAQHKKHKNNKKCKRKETALPQPKYDIRTQKRKERKEMQFTNMPATFSQNEKILGG